MRINKSHRDRLEKQTGKSIHKVGVVQNFRDNDFAEVIMTDGDGNFSTVFILRSGGSRISIVENIGALINAFDASVDSELETLRNQIANKDRAAKRAKDRHAEELDELKQSHFDPTRISFMFGLSIVLGFLILVSWLFYKDQASIEGFLIYVPVLLAMLVASSLSVVFGRHFYSKFPGAETFKKLFESDSAQ